MKPSMPLILLVDDDQHYRQTLKERLERAGKQVIEAGGVDEVTQIMQEQAALPALAIVDMRLEGDDLLDPARAGLQLLQTLGEKGVPAIVVTAYEDFKAIQRAFTELESPHRPRDYLSKSDGEAAVVRSVEKVLQEQAFQAKGGPGGQRWYRSPRAWFLGFFTALMMVGLYIAITTEHSQLLAIVMVGVLVEILAEALLRFMQF